MKKTILFVGLFYFAIANLVSCKSKEAETTLKFTVTFIKGEAKTINVPATIKVFDTISESETVQTGKDATVDLNSDLGAIRLLGDTNVNLKKLSKDVTTFEVSQGNILVKSSKLSKGQTLNVITPTVVAAVRGTQFWGQVNKETESGTFAVRDGAVEITRKSDQSVILIEKGQALDIDPKSTSWKVRTAKQGELDAMAQIDEMK